MEHFTEMHIILTVQRIQAICTKGTQHNLNLVLAALLHGTRVLGVSHTLRR